MKEHPLSEKEIEELMSRAQVGRIATQNSNGFPYITPVHFVYENNTIYIHGLIKGQKVDNIANNSKVCFETDEMKGLIMNEAACDVNTEYESVIAFGNASMLEDMQKKSEVLDKIVGKYTPQLSGQTYPENMLKATGIIMIEISECTGKFYK